MITAKGDRNVSEWLKRTELLLGEEAVRRLQAARVAVFGVGGVGGYAVEALVRSGVGEIDIFDNDTVSVTNINRQIIAACDTVGRSKVDVCKERALSINPDAVINAHNCFFMPDNSAEFNFTEYDYVIDAIDTVTGKIEIIMCAKAAGVPVISSMGAGNKLDASAFEVSDIYRTEMCPLARTMRTELKKRGVKDLKVVYSKEKPIKPVCEASDTVRRAVPGSVAFVPAVAGLIAAGEVIKDIAFRECK